MGHVWQSKISKIRGALSLYDLIRSVKLNHKPFHHGVNCLFNKMIQIEQLGETVKKQKK